MLYGYNVRKPADIVQQVVHLVQVLDLTQVPVRISVIKAHSQTVN